MNNENQNINRIIKEKGDSNFKKNDDEIANVEILALKRRINELDLEIYNLYRSRSWRYTASIRNLFGALRKLREKTNNKNGEPSKSVGNRLPNATQYSTQQTPVETATTPQRVQRVTENNYLYYDVSEEILEKNRKTIENSKAISSTTLDKVVWLLPNFDHILRGGIYTIFRFASHFSREFGTLNVLGIHSRDSIDVAKLSNQIRSEFPDLKFNIVHLPDLDSVDRLPDADAAFCTLWTTAYLLVRYNRCIRKYYFLQDFEPAFYAAGTTYGLIEQTYKFGFFGLANTPGVAEIYRRYNPWVCAFIPGVDRDVFHPSNNVRREDRPNRVVFYGRPRNDRNAFELGLAALGIVKDKLRSNVEIISVGAEFSESKYGAENILNNYGVLGSLSEVADLYRSADVGLVFMFTAHPSYQPLEFMASGCPTVTNFNLYTQWLLRDGDNSALAASTPTCIAERLLEVLQNDGLKQRLIKGGFNTIANLDWKTELDRSAEFVLRPSPAPTAFV